MCECLFYLEWKIPLIEWAAKKKKQTREKSRTTNQIRNTVFFFLLILLVPLKMSVCRWESACHTEIYVITSTKRRETKWLRRRKTTSTIQRKEKKIDKISLEIDSSFLYCLFSFLFYFFSCCCFKRIPNLSRLSVHLHHRQQ